MENPICIYVTMLIMERSPLWLSAKLAMLSGNMQLMLFAIGQGLIAGRVEPTGELIQRAYDLLAKDTTTLEEYDELIELHIHHVHICEPGWFDS